MNFRSLLVQKKWTISGFGAVGKHQFFHIFSRFFFFVSCFCVLGKDLTEGKPMGKKPRSSIQAAIAKLRPVECFALPMATSDRQKRWTWLAHLIQRQWQNWPGSIGVAFYRLQAWVFMCFLWYQNGSKWYDVA